MYARSTGPDDADLFGARGVGAGEQGGGVVGGGVGRGSGLRGTLQRGGGWLQGVQRGRLPKDQGGQKEKEERCHWVGGLTAMANLV